MHPLPLPPPPLPFRFRNVGLYLDNSFFVLKQHCMGEGEWVKRHLKLSIESLKGFSPGCFAEVSE